MACRHKRPSQIGPWAFSPRTDFDGLYLCGQSTLSHGVAGVTASGIEAAKAVLNCRAGDILTNKGPGPLFLQAERYEQLAGVFEEKDRTRGSSTRG